MIDLKTYNYITKRSLKKLLKQKPELTLGAKVVEWLNDDDMVLSEAEVKKVMSQIIIIKEREIVREERGKRNDKSR